MAWLTVMVRKRAAEDGSAALFALDDADLLFEGGGTKNLHVSCREPCCGRGLERRDLGLGDVRGFCDGVVPVGEDRGR